MFYIMYKRAFFYNFLSYWYYTIHILLTLHLNFYKLYQLIIVKHNFWYIFQYFTAMFLIKLTQLRWPFLRECWVENGPLSPGSSTLCKIPTRIYENLVK